MRGFLLSVLSAALLSGCVHTRISARRDPVPSVGYYHAIVIDLQPEEKVRAALGNAIQNQINLQTHSQASIDAVSRPEWQNSIEHRYKDLRSSGADGILYCQVLESQAANEGTAGVVLQVQLIDARTLSRVWMGQVEANPGTTQGAADEHWVATALAHRIVRGLLADGLID
jgi:hypothetical protein